jgi:hypothetical protein
MNRAARTMAATVALAVVVTACGGGKSHSGVAPAAPAVNGSTPVTVDNASLNTLRYGAVPTRNSAVTYQPDVVIVDGGASAVRKVSSDGLTWTIKGDAGHAKELAVGKILFVTSRSAGRILAISPDGADFAVTIGPVELTDVIKKADISYDKPLALGSMMFYSAPNLPGASTVPPNDDGSSAPAGSAPPVDSTPPIDSAAPVASDAPIDSAAPDDSTPAPASTSDAAAAQPGDLVLPPVELTDKSVADALPIPTFGSSPGATVDGMALSPSASPAGLGVKFAYNNGGILLTGSALLHLSAPSLQFHLVIDNGVKSASMRLEGAAGLTVSFDAGIDAATGIALDRRVEVPVDISIPIGGPTPLTITIRQTLLFKTAFGAKKATLSGNGDFTFNGGFGLNYSGGGLTLTGPLGFSGIPALVNSISGESLGINGMVIGYQLRVIVGIGAFGFAAGPSFTFVARMGVTNTAAEAAVPCKFGTVNVQLGVGLGYAIPQVITDAINAILSVLNVKAINSSDGTEHFETIINSGQSVPNTAGCKV